ncbi:MAG TPA: hypothetical protein VFX28_11165 [Methylomirabilota bacterium]|nr:hypothetical protein [Methylomirabilota bacterium]
MDAKNLFHTRATYTLERLDYLVALAVLATLTLVHADVVRWGAFAAAFALIDVVGYVPGLLWHVTHPAGRRCIPRVFHVLYNTAHSFSVNAAGVALWYLLEGRLEWAMLAMPIHLCGDRSLFGNIYKPFGLAFEPVRHPAFDRFLAEFETARRW